MSVVPTRESSCRQEVDGWPPEQNQDEKLATTTTRTHKLRHESPQRLAPIQVLTAKKVPQLTCTCLTRGKPISMIPSPKPSSRQGSKQRANVIISKWQVSAKLCKLSYKSKGMPRETRARSLTITSVSLAIILLIVGTFATGQQQQQPIANPDPQVTVQLAAPEVLKVEPAPQQDEGERQLLAQLLRATGTVAQANLLLDRLIQSDPTETSKADYSSVKANLESGSQPAPRIFLPAGLANSQLELLSPGASNERTRSMRLLDDIVSARASSSSQANTGVHYDDEQQPKELKLSSSVKLEGAQQVEPAGKSIDRLLSVGTSGSNGQTELRLLDGGEGSGELKVAASNQRDEIDGLSNNESVSSLLIHSASQPHKLIANYSHWIVHDLPSTGRKASSGNRSSGSRLSPVSLPKEVSVAVTLAPQPVSPTEQPSMLQSGWHPLSNSMQNLTSDPTTELTALAGVHQMSANSTAKSALHVQPNSHKIVFFEPMPAQGPQSSVLNTTESSNNQGDSFASAATSSSQDVSPKLKSQPMRRHGASKRLQTRTPEFVSHASEGFTPPMPELTTGRRRLQTSGSQRARKSRSRGATGQSPEAASKRRRLLHSMEINLSQHLLGATAATSANLWPNQVIQTTSTTQSGSTELAHASSPQPTTQEAPSYLTEVDQEQPLMRPTKAPKMSSPKKRKQNISSKRLTTSSTTTTTTVMTEPPTLIMATQSPTREQSGPDEAITQPPLGSIGQDQNFQHSSVELEEQAAKFNGIGSISIAGQSSNLTTNTDQAELIATSQPAELMEMQPPNQEAHRQVVSNQPNGSGDSLQMGAGGDMPSREIMVNNGTRFGQGDQSGNDGQRASKQTRHFGRRLMDQTSQSIIPIGFSSPSADIEPNLSSNSQDIGLNLNSTNSITPQAQVQAQSQPQLQSTSAQALGLRKAAKASKWTPTRLQMAASSGRSLQSGSQTVNIANSSPSTIQPHQQITTAAASLNSIATETYEPLTTITTSTIAPSRKRASPRRRISNPTLQPERESLSPQIEAQRQFNWRPQIMSKIPMKVEPMSNLKSVEATQAPTNPTASVWQAQSSRQLLDPLPSLLFHHRLSSLFQYKLAPNRTVSQVESAVSSYPFEYQLARQQTTIKPVNGDEEFEKSGQRQMESASDEAILARLMAKFTSPKVGSDSSSKPDKQQKSDDEEEKRQLNLGFYGQAYDHLNRNSTTNGLRSAGPRHHLLENSNLKQNLNAESEQSNRGVRLQNTGENLNAVASVSVNLNRDRMPMRTNENASSNAGDSIGGKPSETFDVASSMAKQLIPTNWTSSDSNQLGSESILSGRHKETLSILLDAPAMNKSDDIRSRANNNESRLPVHSTQMADQGRSGVGETGRRVNLQVELQSGHESKEEKVADSQTVGSYSQLVHQSTNLTGTIVEAKDDATQMDQLAQRKRRREPPVLPATPSHLSEAARASLANLFKRLPAADGGPPISVASTEIPPVSRTSPKPQTILSDIPTVRPARASGNEPDRGQGNQTNLLDEYRTRSLLKTIINLGAPTGGNTSPSPMTNSKRTNEGNIPLRKVKIVRVQGNSTSELKLPLGSETEEYKSPISLAKNLDWKSSWEMEKQTSRQPEMISVGDSSSPLLIRVEQIQTSTPAPQVQVIVVGQSNEKPSESDNVPIPTAGITSTVATFDEISIDDPHPAEPNGEMSANIELHHPLPTPPSSPEAGTTPTSTSKTFVSTSPAPIMIGNSTSTPFAISVFPMSSTSSPQVSLTSLLPVPTTIAPPAITLQPSVKSGLPVGDIPIDPNEVPNELDATGAVISGGNKTHQFRNLRHSHLDDLSSFQDGRPPLGSRQATNATADPIHRAALITVSISSALIILTLVILFISIKCQDSRSNGTRGQLSKRRQRIEAERKLARRRLRSRHLHAFDRAAGMAACQAVGRPNPRVMSPMGPLSQLKHGQRPLGAPYHPLSHLHPHQLQRHMGAIQGSSKEFLLMSAGGDLMSSNEGASSPESSSICLSTSSDGMNFLTEAIESDLKLGPSQIQYGSTGSNGSNTNSNGQNQFNHLDPPQLHLNNSNHRVQQQHQQVRKAETSREQHLQIQQVQQLRKVGGKRETQKQRGSLRQRLSDTITSRIIRLHLPRLLPFLALENYPNPNINVSNQLQQQPNLSACSQFVNQQTGSQESYQDRTRQMESVNEENYYPYHQNQRLASGCQKAAAVAPGRQAVVKPFALRHNNNNIKPMTQNLSRPTDKVSCNCANCIDSTQSWHLPRASEQQECLRSINGNQPNNSTVLLAGKESSGYYSIANPLQSRHVKLPFGTASSVQHLNHDQQGDQDEQHETGLASRQNYNQYHRGELSKRGAYFQNKRYQQHQLQQIHQSQRLASTNMSESQGNSDDASVQHSQMDNEHHLMFEPTTRQQATIEFISDRL